MSTIAKMITEKLSKTTNEGKADQLRNNMQGYVGADFAKKADDTDLLKMADLQDDKAKIYNSQLKPIYDEMDALRKKYKLGKMDRK